MSKYELFWDGPFSQWYPASFIVDEKNYNCAEQYMMARKALLFCDYDSFNEIMSTKSPRKQKEIGRNVKNFHVETWETVARSIVFKGNYAKFKQNPDLKKELLLTFPKTIVEASPYDQIWGIGLGEEDPRAQDETQWKGKNWLGEVLTDLRTLLLLEDKYFLKG